MSEQATDALRILGLGTNEERVVRFLLSADTCSVSSLHTHTGLKRTTLYPVLARLHARGMVRKVRVGRRTHWKAEPFHKIQSLVRQAEDALGKAFGESIDTDVIGIDSKEVGVRVYRGKKQVLHAYKRMLRLSKAERVFAVQGNHSADYVLQYFDKKTIQALHEQFRSAGVILEGINGEHVLSLFKTLPQDYIESHRTRAVVMTLLPDSYMDFSVDVFVMRNTVLFIDLTKEVVILIQNKRLAEFFYKWCTYMKDTGEQKNMDAYLRSLT